MEIYISDDKILKESYTILKETAYPDTLNEYIIKLLRLYKEQVRECGGSWEDIHKYVDKQWGIEQNANTD